MARQLAKAVVAGTREDAVPLDGFLILLKSMSNPRAVEIGRGQIERFHQRAIADAVMGDDAEQRAAVILSLVAGFQLMRQVFGLHALSDTEPELLEGILESVFDLLAADTATTARGIDREP